MKQTAVKWLAEQLSIYGYNVVTVYPELIEQANEMFEQQIKDAYDKGSEAGYELAKNDDFTEGYKTKEAEQYYNETFS